MPSAKKARKSSANTPAEDSTRVSVSGLASENGDGTPQPPSSIIVDQLNFVNIPLPFKSPTWIHRRATTKPTKRTIKQIQLAERERAGGKIIAVNNPAISVAPSEKNSRRGTPVISRPNKITRGKNARFLSKAAKEELAKEEAAAAAAQLEEEDEDSKSNVNGEDEKEDPLLVKDENGNTRKREIITWFTPDAHPSLRPTKKYCDITGLPARYTDPKTKLRYHDLEVYNVIRQLGPGQDQQYLMLRGAQQTLM